jgi:hypothetical protein
METRTLGLNGPTVSAIGLGCMGMSEFYGLSDREAALATIAAALEAGVTLFDTGDFYGMGHNEMLLAEALRGKRDKAFIQVKFGAQRGPDGSFLGIDARPAAVKTALSYTLRRLGTDYVDRYQRASRLLLGHDAPYHPASTGDHLKAYADGREARAGIGSWVTFYNFRRPHQAMNNQTPMAVWRAGMDKIEAAARAADMPLRLDNANALPTYPQQKQKQQEAACFLKDKGRRDYILNPTARGPTNGVQLNDRFKHLGSVD